MAENKEKYIVAADLGTSRMSLIVVKVNGHDSQVVYYNEVASAGIRYSSVYNIMHVTEPLGKLIRDAEEALDIKITQAIVGMPKYPVKQESNSGVNDNRGEDAQSRVLGAVPLPFGVGFGVIDVGEIFGSRIACGACLNDVQED